MKSWTSVFLMTSCLLDLAAAARAGAPLSETSQQQCQSVKSSDTSLIADAPISIDRTRFIEAEGVEPAHCQILGYVAPQSGFDLRLPTEWNGKFMQIGCHGLCGVLSIPVDDCTEPLRRGYACVTTDMGHRGAGALWAYENPQAEIDWAHRAHHRVAIASKAIVTSYYGKALSHSYFAGWSAGSRESMVLAQRYPHDFNGIITGSGPIDWTGAMMNAVWISRTLLDADEKPILKPEDLQLLHTAVLSSCDKDDGVKDGVISNPPKCKLDLARLTCSSRRTTQCLAPSQVDVVNKVYSGPLNSKGESIYAEGALMPGSELSWAVWQNLGLTLGADTYRYMAFAKDPGPGWTIKDFNFDVDPNRRHEMEALYSGTDPDLRAFQSAGGKMIYWQGWSEIPGPPLTAVRYYEAVEKVMGDRAATQRFFRLFMIPGLSHEMENGKAVSINVASMDVLTALENWVEKGIAPEKLIGARRNGTTADPFDTLKQTPSDPRPIVFTRPVYPYPSVARYKGSGDPNDAGSFIPSDR